MLWHEHRQSSEPYHLIERCSFTFIVSLPLEDFDVRFQLMKLACSLSLTHRTRVVVTTERGRQAQFQGVPSCVYGLLLMAAKRGARMMLRDVVRRLRCRLCKTVPSSVWLVDHPVEISEPVAMAACKSAEAKKAGSWSYSGNAASLKSTDASIELRLARLSTGTTLATIRGFALPARLRDALPGTKMVSDVPVAFDGHTQVLRMHRYDPTQALPAVYIDDLDRFLVQVIDAQRITISYEGQVATFESSERLAWR